MSNKYKHILIEYLSNNNLEIDVNKITLDKECCELLDKYIEIDDLDNRDISTLKIINKKLNYKHQLQLKYFECIKKIEKSIVINNNIYNEVKSNIKKFKEINNNVSNLNGNIASNEHNIINNNLNNFDNFINEFINKLLQHKYNIKQYKKNLKTSSYINYLNSLLLETATLLNINLLEQKDEILQQNHNNLQQKIISLKYTLSNNITNTFNFDSTEINECLANINQHNIQNYFNKIINNLIEQNNLLINV